MDETLDVEVLLAWGREWQRYDEAGPGSGCHIPIPVLRQYLTMANAALFEQHYGRPTKRGGGRPRGTGMGGQAAALIANGAREDDALRIISEHHVKPVENVRDALRRHRAGKT